MSTITELKKRLMEKLEESIQTKKAAEEFRKLSMVIESCKTEEHLIVAEKMGELYIKKWGHFMIVDFLIKKMIQNKRNKL